MKKLFIFILLIFIIIVNAYSSKFIEPFDPKNDSFVLLGDSILKNNAYSDKGIDDMLSELTDERTHCYAVDGAIIDNMHLQIEDIPVDLNNKSTIIFLSIGGNDILSHYKSQNKDISTDKLNDLFSDYKKTVLIIQNKMNKSKIVLLDIYYPYNSIYKHYYQTITEWNNMIYSFAKDPKNNILGVLKISTLLTNDKDFSFGIEPSSIGGNKIVVNILKYY